VTVHLPPTDIGAVIALLTLLAGYIPDRPRVTKPGSRHADTQATKAARRDVRGN
jgi:hypothetical protein